MMAHEYSPIEPSDDVAQRILNAETNSLVSWLRSMQKQPGQSFDVVIRQFGGATALMSRTTPGPPFNRVMGLNGQEHKLLDDILYFYHEQGVSCCLDLSPYRTDPSLLFRLARLGFYQSEFHMVLYCFPNVTQPLSPMSVRVVEAGPRDMGVFVDIWNQTSFNNE